MRLVGKQMLNNRPGTEFLYKQKTRFESGIVVRNACFSLALLSVSHFIDTVQAAGDPWGEVPCIWAGIITVPNH